MLRTLSPLLSLFLTLAAAPALGAPDAPADASAFAESLRESLGVPGLSFVATDSDGPIAWGVAGHRSAAAEDPVRRADRFHIGSITKSMTATVAARMVERGELDWDDSIADLSPALAESIPPDAAAATLRQLLAHRAGLADDRFSAPMMMKLWSLEGPIRDQRREASRFALAVETNAKPGTAWDYSNAGYIVAGHLLEVVSGLSWEDLIQRELFEPLGMTTAGQGPPGLDTPDDPQPLGHGRGLEGYNPIPPSIGADNPPVLGPAGRVHCSMDDLATYARAHLKGLRGQDGLVTAETYALLHEDPEGDRYALGWGIAGEGDDRHSAHSGSNTRWLALILVHPGHDLAVVVGMNAVPDENHQVDVLARVVGFLSEEDPADDAP